MTQATTTRTPGGIGASDFLATLRGRMTADLVRFLTTHFRQSVMTEGFSNGDLLNGLRHERCSYGRTGCRGGDAVNIQQLTIAEKAGIQSLKQLRYFLLVAQCEGGTFTEITGIEATADSPDYRSAAGQIRKLMKGSPDRERDGLNLCRYLGTRGHPQRRIVLTAKGKRLRDRLEGAASS